MALLLTVRAETWAKFRTCLLRFFHRSEGGPIHSSFRRVHANRLPAWGSTWRDRRTPRGEIGWTVGAFPLLAVPPDFVLFGVFRAPGVAGGPMIRLRRQENERKYDGPALKSRLPVPHLVFSGTGFSSWARGDIPGSAASSSPGGRPGPSISAGHSSPSRKVAGLVNNQGETAVGSAGGVGFLRAGDWVDPHHRKPVPTPSWRSRFVFRARHGQSVACAGKKQPPGGRQFVLVRNNTNSPSAGRAIQLTPGPFLQFPPRSTDARGKCGRERGGAGYVEGPGDSAGNSDLRWLCGLCIVFPTTLLPPDGR